MKAADRFLSALKDEHPLQVAGAVNAYAAILAQRAGFRALYLSGAGVANASHGLPDLGITTIADVAEDARRISAASDLPLLADIDTGFGGAFNIARSIREMVRAGVAAVHIEDQVSAKRCGHRPGKSLVSTAEMVDRIKAAVDAAQGDLLVMARTDSLAGEGVAAAVERAGRYRDAGAQMLFPEAVRELAQYREFSVLGLPVLANITEFGQTPLFSVEQLREVGVAMALYPLSAFRAMSAAALAVYRAIRTEGSQKSVLDQMQTRAELYDCINYLEYERKLDELRARS
jgi:methylisocitrate lyase